ncbi:MAG: hypothetical protein IJ706_05155 [Clostridia bacterium]|nr:hypothetical protein [Clostridia bacterium]
MATYKKIIGKTAVTLLSAVVLFSAAALAIKPDVFIKSSLSGIKLWAVSVLPSLLPFFFLTALMGKLGMIKWLSRLMEKPMRRLTGCGGATAYAFIMSVMSGYPVGAKIICDLRQNGIIDKAEATRASTFCSTSGPLFIIGAVGVGMFGDKSVGYTIFLSHVLAALCTGVIFSFPRNKNNSHAFLPVTEKADNVLYECVYSSVISVALVGGFICVFYCFADIVSYFGLLRPLQFVLSPLFGSDISKGISEGLIECTRGCLSLSKCGLSTYSVAFCSLVISFGGLSALFQQIAFLKKAEVKTGVFISAKLIQGLIAFLFSILFYNIFF